MAIYVGEELRGKNVVVLNAETAWVNVQVHSAGGEETATLKIYEASTGITFEKVAVAGVLSAVVIEPDGVVGSFFGETLLISADNVAPAIVLLGGEEVSIIVGSGVRGCGGDRDG